jgi:hypothetical protein
MGKTATLSIPTFPIKPCQVQYDSGADPSLEQLGILLAKQNLRMARKISRATGVQEGSRTHPSPFRIQAESETGNMGTFSTQM